MKTIGFITSKKENEYRRALLPNDIKLIKNKKYLYFEKGYGNPMGIDDKEYVEAGANIDTRENILKKDIICDPKVGDSEYIKYLKEGQTIFGWIHAVQNKNITDIIVNNKLTAFAWEDMYDKGKHLFWRNNEIAGQAAIIHAYQCYNIMPYETKVAVLGKGNTARGAIKILDQLSADVTVYDRKSEALIRDEIGNYDVIVNAILWDTSRKDHIIYREDLEKMKKGSMIIDISCDRNGGVETSKPTTIEKPTYKIEGVLHYAVDHTPSLFFKTVSKSLSQVIAQYIDQMIENRIEDVLSRALIIDKGIIKDDRIIKFQNR